MSNPSDVGVSEGAISSQTRQDNIVEKLFPAIEAATEGEDPFDVLGALNFVMSRYQHVVNEKIDLDAIELS